MNHKLIIAHRGASAEAPENTIAAFQKAVDTGADMIELDVRKTKDDVFVVMHDPKIGKCKIKNLTYGQIKNIKPDIVTLEEALESMAGKIGLDIEIKEKDIGKEVAEMAARCFPVQDLLITSSFARVLKTINQVNPLIKTGWIVGNRRWVSVLNAVNLIFKKIPPEADVVVLNWLWYLTGLRFFAKGKDILVFTANNGKIISKLLKSGQVAGVITNDPRLAVKLRAPCP